MQLAEDRARTLGITRNRNNELARLKGRMKAPPKRFSKKALRKAVDDDEITKASLLPAGRPSEIEMTSTDPEWMPQYRELCALLREVEILQGELRKEKLRKMASVREDKHDQLMQRFAGEAASKLAQCERKLKQLEEYAKFNHETPAQTRTLTSVLYAMANQIRQQARELRGQQQSELYRERQLNSYNKTPITQLPTSTGESETESWLSQQEFEAMESNMAQSRNEEVTKIVQSIYSLNELFKQFQGLVIEQGSLLDRIDANIENTAQAVSQGNKHLEEANRKQESSCFNKLRLILAVLIALLLAVFFIKHT